MEKDFKEYLKATDIIDYHDANIQALAKKYPLGTSDDDETIAKNCYESVRNNIHHSGNYKDDITTVTASEVLKHGTGWCYTSAQKTLPKGALETITDYGSSSFGGACPQKNDKAHEYKITIYALDTDKLDVTAKSDSALVGFIIKFSYYRKKLYSELLQTLML